jgi:hypothetical protein
MIIFRIGVFAKVFCNFRVHLTLIFFFKDKLRQVSPRVLRQGGHEEFPRASQHFQQLLPSHQSRQGTDHLSSLSRVKLVSCFTK